MYNESIKKYNTTINKLNRELMQLKQALFNSIKDKEKLETAKSKLYQENLLLRKEINSLKVLVSKEKTSPTRTRNYKKKK